MSILEWIWDRIGYTTEVHSFPPPPAMAGRTAVELHAFQQTGEFVVVSRAAGDPPTGAYAVHKATIWNDWTCAWAGPTVDASYGAPQPYDSSDVRRHGRLYMPIGYTVEVGPKSFRIYLGHAFAGAVTPSLDASDEVLAAVNWWGQDFIVISKLGSVFQYRCQDRLDGTFELQLLAQDHTLRTHVQGMAAGVADRSRIVRANVFTPNDILIELPTGETTEDRWPANQLLWFMLGNLYGQSAVPQDNEILGRRFWQYSWRSDPAAPVDNRLLLTNSEGPLNMLFYPQTGGSQWKRFRCTGPGARRDGSGYDIGGRVDVAVFGGAYKGGSLLLVTRLWYERSVEVSRIVPNFEDETFSVHKMWHRTTDKRPVAARWYSEDDKPRYVALFEDGTIEVVRRT